MTPTEFQELSSLMQGPRGGRRGGASLTGGTDAELAQWAIEANEDAQIAARIRAWASDFARDHQSISSRLFKLAGFMRDGWYVKMDELWDGLEPDIECALAVMAGGPTSTETTEVLVRNYIARYEADHGLEKLLKLTRDGIAKAVGRSAGAVSSTKAWKDLAAAQRRSRLPDEETRRRLTTFE